PPAGGAGLRVLPVRAAAGLLQPGGVGAAGARRGGSRPAGAGDGFRRRARAETGGTAGVDRGPACGRWRGGGPGPDGGGGRRRAARGHADIDSDSIPELLLLVFQRRADGVVPQQDVSEMDRRVCCFLCCDWLVGARRLLVMLYAGRVPLAYAARVRGVSTAG